MTDQGFKPFEASPPPAPVEPPAPPKAGKKSESRARGRRNPPKANKTGRKRGPRVHGKRSARSGVQTDVNGAGSPNWPSVQVDLAAVLGVAEGLTGGELAALAKTVFAVHPLTKPEQTNVISALKRLLGI